MDGWPAQQPLLYSTGIRYAELIGIAIHDIDLTDQYIKGMGKGGKERLVHRKGQGFIC